MRNTWRTPVGGVATYSVIRLWNKGDKTGSMLGMFLTLLGPVGCFFLLCFLIIAVVNFWMWLIGAALLLWASLAIAISLSMPKYFFNAGFWWTTEGDNTHVVDTAWMQEKFTKKQRVEMQRKFLKALGKYRDNYPNMSLDVL